MPISHFTAALLGAALAEGIPLWVPVLVALLETAYYVFTPWWEIFCDRRKSDGGDGRQIVGGFRGPERE